MNKCRKITAVFVAVVALLGVVALGINFYVILSQKDMIITTDELEEKNNIEYIMVLGCAVFGDEPSDMLEDRLLRAVEVAKTLPDAKLIVSGNNNRIDYDEVSVMKRFCIENGIDESRVLSDDDGFSTGESVTNLNNIFGAENAVIVTQKYHLYRALHIASQYDIEACGVASNQRKYAKQFYYSLREVAARNKDFFKYLFV